MRFVPKGQTNNIMALVQIMVWCRTDEKSLSGPLTIILVTHICVIRSQWVDACTKINANLIFECHKVLVYAFSAYGIFGYVCHRYLMDTPCILYSWDSHIDKNRIGRVMLYSHKTNFPL